MLSRDMTQAQVSLPRVDMSLPKGDPTLAKAALLLGAGQFTLDRFTEGPIVFTDGSDSTFRRPIRSPSVTITSRPQPNRPSPTTPGKIADHTGIDLDTSSTPIQAIAAGRVTKVVNKTNYDDNSCGYRVNIDHGGIKMEYGDGSYTLKSSLYCHLSSTNVEEGATVNAGDLLGVSGDTGNTTGDHLHLQLVVPGVSPTDEGPYAVYFDIVTSGASSGEGNPGESSTGSPDDHT